MSPLPRLMRNRWFGRREPAVGHGVVYWHFLLSECSEVCRAVAQAQQALAGFPGLHMTPEKRLHMTVCVVGSTDDMTREEMGGLLLRARKVLRRLAPVSTSLDRVLYHQEAIMLGVDPVAELASVRHEIVAMTEAATGRALEVPADSVEWHPHITVSYSTAEQDAAPIIAALGTSIGPQDISLDEVALIVQWGPERLWDWETIGAVELGS